MDALTALLRNFLNPKSVPPPETKEEYWQRRWDESLQGKKIVTRYLACFGGSHYGEFCGIKKIRGYYDMTYSYFTDNRPVETVPIFYQIDFDDSRTKYGHTVDRCFVTREVAQDYYDFNVKRFTEPLQKRIDDLNAAKSR